MIRTTCICLTVGLVASLGSTPARAQFPPAEGFVESQTLPIRVYYNTEEKLPLANVIVGYAEQAWYNQVDEMGFSAPNTVNDNLEVEPGIRYYLMDTDYFAGMVLPMVPIVDSPYTNAATITLIWDGLPESYVESTVHHEFNHSVQYAVDCADSYFAYEQVTVAVTHLALPEEGMFASMLPEFQGEPHHSLYYTDFSGMSYYHFGAALFAYFLEQQYGNADGKLLARMWAATPQVGNVDLSTGWCQSDVDNEPDLLDAMKTVLAEEGVSFDDAFAEFSLHRYFVGSYADGNHIPGAEDWLGAEPAMDSRYFADELPVEGAEPIHPPEGLGVSYIAFDLIGQAADQAFRLKFGGDSAVSWSVAALVIRDDGVREIPVSMDENQSGSLIVSDVGGTSRIVLAATNLGDGSEDSDDTLYPAANFVYSAAVLECPAVAIADLAPHRIHPGDTTTVTITGSGFASGQGIDVSVSGEGVTVVNTVRRDAQTIDVTFEVDPGVDTGSRDLSIALECGSEITAPKMLKVAKSGGCQSSPGAPSGWAAMTLLGLWLAGRRLRRLRRLR